MDLKYSYTNTIVKHLTEISAAKEIIDNAYILPQWEIKLRETAVLLNAHHSTRIEGNTLTLEEVSALSKGRKIMAARKERLEVLNYLNVLSQISKYAKNVINEKLFLKLHRDLTKGTLDKNEYCGKYRKFKVVVRKRSGEKLIVSFEPPPFEKVPEMIRSFLRRLNREKKDLNPVILAGVSHYEIARIHPFVDGNGRTARAFATLLLVKFGFDIHRFFALDDYYDSSRQDYYKALQTVDPKKLDITKWLEYFTFGVKESVKRVKDKVLELSRERRAASLEGKVYLSKNQMRILHYLDKNRSVASKELVKLLKVTRQAVNKDINRLLELDLIKRIGSGPAVKYLKN